MTEKKTELRKQAEEIVRKKAAQLQENIVSLSLEETRQTLHDLLVHQIELEIQNEELRRTQGELEASRTRYSDLYDLAPLGYVTLSEKGLILEANLTAVTMLGVARSALVKQPLTRYIINEDQDIFYFHRKQLFDTGMSQACELRMMKMDRTEFWAQLESTAVQDNDGKPVYYIVLSDITDRKQTEENLKLFKSIVEKSSEAIAISNSKGSLIYINIAHEKIFGRTSAEGKHLNYRDYYPPESIEVLNNVVAPALERGESWEGELDAFDAAGKKFPLWEHADSILDSSG
jgi:PAS domain S-box-containing protein